MNDSRTNAAEVAIAWVLTVLTVGYFLPWAIAATRGKSNSGAIALLNFLLGWTLIGWIVALVMACGAHQQMAVPYAAAPQGYPPPPYGQQPYAQPYAPPQQAYAPPAQLTPQPAPAAYEQPAAYEPPAAYEQPSYEQPAYEPGTTQPFPPEQPDPRPQT